MNNREQFTLMLVKAASADSYDQLENEEALKRKKRDNLKLHLAIGGSILGGMGLSNYLGSATGKKHVNKLRRAFSFETPEQKLVNDLKDLSTRQ